MASLAEQLALQQQIEFLQAQQQQILNAYQQQAGRIGGSSLPFNPPPLPHLSPQQQQFQFPQPQPTVPVGAPTQPSSHRRQASGLSGGPPPAPSSGTSANLTDNSGGPQRRPSGGQSPGGQGHVRRHSLALADAKKAAEQAQARRNQVGFQFPTPGSGVPNAPSQPPNPITPNTAATPPPTTATTTTTTTANESSSTTTASSGSSLGSRSRMSGHGRSQSLAVSGTTTRGGTANTGRIGGFHFPAPAATGETALSQSGQQTTGQSVERRSSGHQRSGSRNFDANWRNTGQNQNTPAEPQVQTQPQQQFTPAFQPGHRARASMGTIGTFTFPTQQVLIPSAPAQGIFMNPTTGQTQLLNPGLIAQQHHLTQLHLQHAAQALNVQPMGIGPISVAHGPQQMTNQQQRKTLFTPYLPQANLPALLADGQLVSGILRVNKKNRNDAYVSTQDGLLDADIFICGSKDRNRALEGDLVAVELLDVDQVWGQKREKEEKKKRKDNPGATAPSSSTGGAGVDGQEKSGQEGGGVRRKGSLTLRSTQKKNDDVEVEGQSLLLVEEEEINDEQKPLYAGHIVAVIERVAGQMFSGYVSEISSFYIVQLLISNIEHLDYYGPVVKQQKKSKRLSELPVREALAGSPNQNASKKNPKSSGLSPRIREFLLSLFPLSRHREILLRTTNHMQIVFSLPASSVGLLPPFIHSELSLNSWER